MSHTAPAGEICLTASALVFTDDPEPRVLVHQHKRYPFVLQPGGHVDPGEHPWAAVLRELEEETGTFADQLHALTAIEFTPGPGRFPAPVDLDVHQVTATATHTDLIFAFVIDAAPRGRPLPGESTQVFWASVPELAANPLVPARVADVAAALVPALRTWPRVPASRVGLGVREQGRG